MKKVMYVYNGKVVKTVDGDTLDIDVDLGFNVHTKVRVRVVGPNHKRFDAPELRLEEKEQGVKAKRLLEGQFFHDPNVTIRTYKATDKYGRWVAEVWFKSSTTQRATDSLDVASFLVSKKLGEWE
tara:strand:+ start:3279 stop:3653 length:375 start_codon:yes stop_codon:yes gene_type:complete